MIESILTFVVAVILVWFAFSFFANVLHAALFILAVVLVYAVIRGVVARYPRR